MLRYIFEPSTTDSPHPTPPSSLPFAVTSGQTHFLPIKRGRGRRNWGIRRGGWVAAGGEGAHRACTEHKGFFAIKGAELYCNF